MSISHGQVQPAGWSPTAETGRTLPLTTDATGALRVTGGSGGATGPGTAATAQRVTYASDGATVPVKGAPYTQLGYQQISNATLANSTGLTVPGGATVAIVQNNGSQPARYRPDGATTAPTASVGKRLAAGDEKVFDLVNGSLSSLRFIREADGVTLDIDYYA